ncbi:unnamed protein product [Clonostachys rhizophaga]|uniref:Uncharacterized protein n=1 Tax=Clonostachys rhizophaga TaxID=160324 RepID=A0A9N9V6G5_9HYPO|nr:unnamed protein product [Clonostachys rhizophaga]
MLTNVGQRYRAWLGHDKTGQVSRAGLMREKSSVEDAHQWLRLTTTWLLEGGGKCVQITTRFGLAADWGMEKLVNHKFGTASQGLAHYDYIHGCHY